MTYKKTLGLKVNIQSIGYALAEETESELKFLRTGVHYFKGCENPKTKEGLGVQRQEWRSLKKTIYRKQQRKKALVKLLKKYEYTWKESPSNVWQHRAAALNEYQDISDLIAILYHFANHNGYFSYKRLENQDKMLSDGKVNSALVEIEKRMTESGCRTYGEYMNMISPGVRDQKRNKRGEYTYMPKREWLMDEFDQIMSAQRVFYTEKNQRFFTEDQVTELKEEIFKKRPLKSVGNLIGKCSLLPEEKRAPKFHPLAIKFVLISQLQQLKVHIPEEDTTSFELLADHQDIVWNHVQSKGRVTFAELKKLFNLPKGSVIKGGKKETGTFFEVPQWVEFREILNVEIKDASSTFIKPTFEDFFLTFPQKMEQLVFALSFIFEEDQIKSHLKKNAFSEFKGNDLDIIDKLLSIQSFSHTINLSLKALCVLLPYMERGLDFKDALEHARFNKQLPSGKLSNKKVLCAKLPAFPVTPNPVVNRACSQARKIINAILNEHGKPDAIHIEIGTELGKPPKTRRQIEKKMRAAEADKKSAHYELIENNIHPTAENILKYRVWKSQKGLDFLTNQHITLDDLFDIRAVGMTQIWDQSPNMTIANLMVTLKSNLNNKNTLLTEKHTKHIKGEIEELHPSKLYFMEKFLNNAESSMSLTATAAWVTVALRNFLQENFGDVDILCVPKGVLPAVKVLWNDIPSDQITYQYPLLDAVCLSAISRLHIKDIQKAILSDESRMKLGRPFSPSTLNDIISNAYPTLQLEKKQKGAGHQQTRIRLIDEEKKELPNGSRIIFPKTREEDETPKLLKRIPLQHITEKNFELIWNFKNNPDLKDILKERLDAFKWDAEKAFTEPVYIKSIWGDKTKQLPIYYVRIYDDSRVGVKINNSFTNYGDMASLYIYKLNNRFYGSPIYSMDILQKINAKRKQKEFVFPTTMISSSGELPLDPDAEYVCHLVKGEYVKLISTVKLEDNKTLVDKEVEGYFNGYNRSTNTIILSYSRSTIDTAPSSPIIEIPTAYGIGTLKEIKKYFVTPLGEKHEVKKLNQLEIGVV